MMTTSLYSSFFNIDMHSGVDRKSGKKGTRTFTNVGFHFLQNKRRRAVQPKGALQVTASSAKKILVMGGTRFIGVFLSRLLVKDGHQVTLFTRGKAPITTQLPGESDQEYSEFSSKVLHLKGDRKDFDFVKTSLSAEGFDVVYDINGREAVEVEPILDALPKLEQYIYCSSAGVYLKTDFPPHFETDAVDPKSRHKGKLETESLLASRGVNYTSIRPVYIYGPLNYNPVEEWFFHRLKAGRPIPVPNSGIQITQLGHVKDLAKAFVKVLGNPKASKQVYNISGSKYVTFDGLAKACAKAGGFPEPEIVHYNPEEFDFGKKKAFPFRDQHFFASIEKATRELDWKPEFDLVSGLTDSYELDFGRGTYRKEPDFTTDDMILDKSESPVISTFSVSV
ncbi:chloroplast stem-loop binding protein of 41 kDa b, chloroplastic [Iris pallida]|uniref:Chloroplast stem-loop binding protein of 41 kDa b, chloroplastic n=1 Tax=Iris pallida TaxID=29817 RepID=A0AAX6I5Q2_IRIPA|nr:chloroplast stem-loop binding protein of 41 kDa b, chloroplastic [Iris pallida]